MEKHLNIKNILISIVLVLLFFVVPSVYAVTLNFEGTITNLRKYEYNNSTNSYTYDNNTAVNIPLSFSITMDLGITYQPVPLSDFLVLAEPTPIYTEMNWKDLNQALFYYGGLYLSYSEAHTEGYNKDTFYSHRVEIQSEMLSSGWGSGNGNSRYDLLYNYLNVADLFRYQESAYTCFNWDPPTSSPNGIAIGQEARGRLTLTNIAFTSTPVPEPSTMLLLGSGLIGLVGYGRRKFFKK